MTGSRKIDRVDAISLAAENQRYRGTGGVSDGNRGQGFCPAFREIATGRIEIARFRDGRRAPFHCLEGVPPVWAAQLDDAGLPTALLPGIEAGFVRDGRFYTRCEAAAATEDATAAAR